MEERNLDTREIGILLQERKGQGGTEMVMTESIFQGGEKQAIVHPDCYPRPCSLKISPTVTLVVDPSFSLSLKSQP